MSRDFYKSVMYLDQIKRQEKLSEKELMNLLRDLRSLARFRYFFYNLENEHFLSIIAFRSFLSKALSDKHSDRPYIVSQYLKRMASKKSDETSQVIRKSRLADFRVVRNILETILFLDVDHAAQLVNFVTSRLLVKRHSDGELLGRLIVKYIDGDKVKEAALLFDCLCTPSVRKVAAAVKRQFPTISHEEAEGLLEQYEFVEMTKLAFPYLLEKIPLNLVKILESNIHRALDIEFPKGKGKRKEDFSYIWRPAIEEHEQNYELSRFKDALVSTLRDALITLLKKQHNGSLWSILKRFLKSRYTIFKRLALFTMSENAEQFMNLIKPLVLQNRNLDDHRIRHELFGLLKKSFPLFDEVTRQHVVSWIEAGPDTNWWIKWRTKEEGKPPSAESIQRFVNHWKLERYWIVRDHLPEKAQVIIQLERELGTPQHPDFPTWHESSVGGYESPFNLTEFLQKTDNELIEIFKNPPPVKEPDPIFRHQGLGMIFEGAIKESPSRFLPFAKVLAENKVLPVFVSHYFRGLREVWPLEKTEWKPQWTNELHILATQVADGKSNFHQWSVEQRSSLRLDLARLIEGIVSIRSLTHTADELNKLKVILLDMLGDPDPTESAERENYSTNKDWPFIALNHTSGEVLHALMKYALCYARYHPTVGERLEKDVREALETVLITEKRPSIFSVFGTYLANLWYLDATWTQNNLDLLFPKNDTLRFAAAWDAYLKFNNVYKDVYEALKSFYRKAIISGTKGRNPEDFDLTRLAQHLSLVYLRGWEDVTVRNSNVAQFFSKAPVTLRVSFIRQIRIGLQEMNKTDQLKENPQAWNRAKALWSWRARKAQSLATNKRQEDELSAFLDWLSVCPEDLPTMKDLISKSLRRWKAQYHSGAVTEYIARQSENYPELAVSLLVDFFLRPWDQYYYYFNEKEVREVLENALKAGEKSAVVAANVASKLGEYGRFDFKHIWDNVLSS